MRLSPFQCEQITSRSISPLQRKLEGILDKYAEVFGEIEKGKPEQP